MAKHTNPTTLLAATLLAALPATGLQAAANSEQIVFSGVGLPPVSSEPFGFWVWCQNEQAPNSEGHSRYETDCNGAMYFYARGVVRHVVGEVTEPDEGQYSMQVNSKDGSVVCTLVNVPPIESGPNNTVTAECTVNQVPVSGLESDDAVVNATGP